MNKINTFLFISLFGSLSLHAMEQESFRNWVSKKRKEVTLAAPKSLLPIDQLYKEAEQNEQSVAIINATTQGRARKTRKFAQSDPGSAKKMMTFINQKEKSADFKDPELDRFAAGIALTEFAKPSNDLVLAMLEYAKLEESETNNKPMKKPINKPIEKTDEILDSEPVQESNEIPVKIAAQNRSPVVEKDQDEIMRVLSDEEMPFEVAQVEVVQTPIETIAPSLLEVAPFQKQDVSPIVVQNPVEEIAPSPIGVVAPIRPFQDEIDALNQALKKHCRLTGKELLDALENEVTLKDPGSFLNVAYAINCKEAIDFALRCIAKQNQA